MCELERSRRFGEKGISYRTRMHQKTVRVPGQRYEDKNVTTKIEIYNISMPKEGTRRSTKHVKHAKICAVIWGVGKGDEEGSSR